VTADGAVLVANACNHDDLFWGIKGGGGGSLGVLTKLTLRTRDLPATFGLVTTSIKASSDSAFRELIGRTIRFYAEKLFNPHWGEQIAFGADNTVGIYMVFQGLPQTQAEAIWAPFMSAIAATPQRFTVLKPLSVLTVPARKFWDAEHLANTVPDLIVSDNRSSAPTGNFFYAGDAGQVGFFIHGYKSAWLSASLLEPARQQSLVDALFARSISTRAWPEPRPRRSRRQGIRR
jgi:hypothetical protein